MAKAKPNTDAKDEVKNVLPKEVRLMMVSALESINDLDADSYEDDVILKKYNDYVLSLEQKVSSYETSSETKSLNVYLAKASQFGEIRVEDKEFLARLFRLNIPPYYVHLFRKDHVELKDDAKGNRELWRVINKSGISPVKEISQLAKMKRSPVRPKIM